MKIYHYDNITKIFTGEGEADKNPIRENDYIIPAFCTLIKPPEIDFNKQEIFWSGTDWQVKDIPTPEPDPKPDPEISENSAWQIIYDKKERLLRGTDYRVLPDANPETKELWLAYRETLRNITESFSTPEGVIWPVPPEL